MGSFAQFIEKSGIKAESLVRVSARLEHGAEADARARIARAAARREKKSYAELSLAKPASGRGVSALQIAHAMKDLPLPRRARQKLLRAVRLMSKNEGLDVKTLFGEIGVRAGLRRIEAAKKKAAAAGKK